jgi:hypothetical protein
MSLENIRRRLGKISLCGEIRDVQQLFDDARDLLVMIDDYEEVLADHRRLVRQLDMLLNGSYAAKQASLCDIVSQVASEGIKSLQGQVR